jgi:hypothetical protein
MILGVAKEKRKFPPLSKRIAKYYRLGVAHSFLMLKALFLTLP